MRHAVSIYLLGLGGLHLCFFVLGYGATFLLAYGALTTMAALISATFVWLYYMRATPLALAMAFSWAGAASVMGWWWLYNVLGHPVWMRGHQVLFVFLSFYLGGAALHFDVVQRSMALPRYTAWVPLVACALLSALLLVLLAEAVVWPGQM